MLPLTVSQSLVSISQFNLTYGFITPTSKIYFFKSFIGALFFVFLNMCRYLPLLTYLNMENVRHATFFAVYIDIFFHGFGLILIYIVNILQSDNSVLIVLKLQQAMRVIDLDTPKVLSNHKFWNWVCLLGLFGVYALSNVISTVLYADHYQQNLILYLAKFSSITFDVYQISMSRTVILIVRLLLTWNRRIVILCQKTPLRGRQDTCKDGHMFKAMALAYANIMQSFKLCKAVYQVSILYYTIASFVNILTKLDLFLELGSEHKKSTLWLLRRVWLFTWNFKNITLLIIMSEACEQFYAHVRATESTCAQIVAAQEQDSDLRRLCKNVVRYNRAAGGKLRACGVLAVDAALPPRVLAAVLAYTVVLLQFAFLN